MQIIRCTTADDHRWNVFVQENPQASFYHRAEWRDVNQDSFGHDTCHLAAVDNDRIAGVFPLVRMRTVLLGNIACSMPFVNFGGPASENDRVERALLEAATSVAEEWKVEYLEIRSQRFLGDRLPSSDHKVSMTVPLTSDPESLWTAFKSNHRNEIRKGYKNGFTARVGHSELLDDFYAVLSESWRDLGTPIYSKKYLQTIVAAFGDAVRITVVYAGAEPAAAAFDGLHRDTIEGMWMGTRAKFRNQFAGYVLYWELIKNGCESGFSTFHLGRSTAQSGGETFKRKWNAKALPLYWHYLLQTRSDIPQLNVANRKYRFAIAVWQKLPLPITKMFGPLIASRIP